MIVEQVGIPVVTRLLRPVETRSSRATLQPAGPSESFSRSSGRRTARCPATGENAVPARPADA